MSAEPEHVQSWQRRHLIAFEGHDRRSGPHDEGAVGCRQEYGGVVEALTPFHTRRVEVRVGDSNRGDAAQFTYGRDRFVIEVAHAVPEQVARLTANQERVLPDGELWVRRDPNETGFQFGQYVAEVPLHIVQGGPALTAKAYVLTLVLTDRASLRKIGPIGLLDAASDADMCGHDLLLVSKTVRAPTSG